jgi:hypothetical protein
VAGSSEIPQAGIDDVGLEHDGSSSGGISGVTASGSGTPTRAARYQTITTDKYGKETVYVNNAFGSTAIGYDSPE